MFRLARPQLTSARRVAVPRDNSAPRGPDAYPPNARGQTLVETAMITLPALVRPVGQRRVSGQALVEFALILPIFVVLFFGIIEFAFLFNAQLSLNYATRDAALIAAEAGNNANADCQILRQVNNDLTAPTDKSRVLTVHIFSATETGGPLAVPKKQTYTPGGTTTCGTITVPFTLGTNDYPYNVRCNDLDRTACPAFTGPSNTGVDIIGVRVEYGYRFVTPLSTAFSLLGAGGTPLWGGAGMLMDVGNAMRMEPVL
jgi:Flp pilus assembly protein TadG